MGEAVGGVGAGLATRPGTEQNVRPTRDHAACLEQRRGTFSCRFRHADFQSAVLHPDTQAEVIRRAVARHPEPVLAACKEFEESLRPGERFTFEYVMLDGVNDSDEQARRLANLLNRHQLRAKVNLIPHNPAEELPYRPSTPERVEAFKATLEAKGVHAYVRRPRGRDIYAACGQLAARREGAPPALYQLS